MKIKKYELVYITFPPVIRHHKMPSRKKPFPFRWTRKGVWTPAQNLKLNSIRADDADNRLLET
jgi:hypothetical protein